MNYRELPYEDIQVAKNVLKAAGIKDIPNDEQEIRKQAFECLRIGEPLTAHCLRLGKRCKNITEDEWNEIFEISGKGIIFGSIAAFDACDQLGLIGKVNK